MGKGTSHHGENRSSGVAANGGFRNNRIYFRYPRSMWVYTSVHGESQIKAMILDPKWCLYSRYSFRERAPTA